MTLKNPKNLFSSSLLILPILLCLGFLLWNNCQAKSDVNFNKNSEKTNKLFYWLISNKEENIREENDDENIIVKNVFGSIRDKFVKLKNAENGYRYKQKLRENNDNDNNDSEEDSSKIITPLQNERFNSFSSDESVDDYVEPVIPWFSDWERMVEEEKEEKKKHSKTFVKNSSPHSINQIERPRNIQGPCLLRRNKPVQHRTYPRSYEFPGFEASIPRNWDWRNVNGINFCSPTRNQHIPVYCGGCWVFGSLGSLNDRFNIARKNRWPMTNISPQEVIACNGKGSCNGGTPEDVFEHAKTVGLVEEGCNNFKAVNEKCSPFTRCGSCWPDKCFSIQNYTRYYIKDFGKVTGRLQMMSEIHNRGPISCLMGCTPSFDLNYTSGIYREHGDYPPNHIVSVTGWDWDEETKTEYWIVRNSWGEAWGEIGWFRIVTSLFNGGRGDQFNLGIERECYFADPDVSNLN